MFSDFIAWLNSQTTSTAAFIGTMSGSAIGLFAILVGALCNAHLNRRRDDRLRQQEKLGVLLAIRSELQNVRKALFDNLDRLSKPKSSSYLVPDVAKAIRIFPAFITRLSLLDGETIHHLYDTYWLIDEYSSKLVLLGGVKNLRTDSDRTISIQMPSGTEENVKKLNKAYVQRIDSTLETLNNKLGRRHTKNNS